MDSEDNSCDFIVNGRGYKLYGRYWKPKEKPKALVFVSHGFTEHSQYYQALANEIVNMNCFVFAHDHVGHGRSEGPRVQIEDLDHYVDDVFQHTDLMKQKFPNLPLFYIGHSMGGTIGAKAIIKRPNYFSGVILSGPAVSISYHAVGPLVKYLARMLGWLVPNFPVVPLDYNAITRDIDITNMRKEDPLSWHGYAKAGWAYALLRSLEDIRDNISKIECPLLLLHGDNDKICDVEGSKILYGKCSSIDKTLKLYPKGFHNLLDEPEGLKETVMEDITKWLDQRIK